MPTHTRALTAEERDLLAPVLYRKERAHMRAQHLAEEVETANVALAQLLRTIGEGLSLTRLPSGEVGIAWAEPEVDVE